MSFWNLNIVEWVGVGYAAGDWIRDNTGFDEWWYEWNGSLDDAFFNWVDDTFCDQPYGDFPEISETYV